MDESTRAKIKVQLHKLGYSELGLTEKKWQQLEAIFKATTLMNERSREARSILKVNRLTVANAERILKEMGGVTITDQTMRNGGGMLEKFLLSFEEETSSIDVRKENERYKKRIAELEERLKKMYQRDAECQDALEEAARLREDNDILRQDKKDLEIRLTQMENRSHKKIMATQLDLTQTSDIKN